MPWPFGVSPNQDLGLYDLDRNTWHTPQNLRDHPVWQIWLGAARLAAVWPVRHDVEHSHDPRVTTIRRSASAVVCLIVFTASQNMNLIHVGSNLASTEHDEKGNVEYVIEPRLCQSLSLLQRSL